MDIGSAFSFMFDDEEWIKKLAIGGGIALGSMILIPALFLGIILIFPLYGYMMQVLKNVRDGQPRPLPEWTDFGDFFRVGFVVFVITLIYNIPILILLCAIVSVAALPGMMEMNPEASGMIYIVQACLYCLLFFILALVNAIVPAGLIRYAHFGNFRSAFQFGEIFNFIRANLGDYLITVLLVWVAQFIAQFGFLLCGIGLVFTFFWSFLVNGHLYGQLARKV